MGIGEIIWLFFMLSALQPVVKQRMLEASRMRVMHRFERARKSRVIALVHRQETMSFLGFPLMRYIDVNDSEDVLRAIKLTADDCPIDLIVHTPGGLVLAALATGVWTHDYGIHAEEAKSLGLPISTDMPEEVYQFMSLFPQPTRPSVEYVPMPYVETSTTPPAAEGPGELATLAGTMEDLARRGFAEHFRVVDRRLSAMSGGDEFTAAQVKVAAYYRFDGVSDPGDMAILYAIETGTGVRGTISDAFGVYADPFVGAFMKAATACRSLHCPGAADGA